MSNEMNQINAGNEVKLQKLLQLKRLETPGEPYLDAFLEEFHRYQRADLLKETSLFARLQTRLQDLFFFQPQKTWAMASVCAAIVLLVSLSVMQHSETASSSLMTESAFPVAPLSTDEVQLVSDSSFERDFSSPRYVTGQTPLSYDTALAF
jgi:hypothetical protein